MGKKNVKRSIIRKCQTEPNQTESNRFGKLRNGEDGCGEH